MYNDKLKWDRTIGDIKTGIRKQWNSEESTVKEDGIDGNR